MTEPLYIHAVGIHGGNTLEYVWEPTADALEARVLGMVPALNFGTRLDWHVLEDWNESSGETEDDVKHWVAEMAGVGTPRWSTWVRDGQTPLEAVRPWETIDPAEAAAAEAGRLAEALSRVAGSGVHRAVAEARDRLIAPGGSAAREFTPQAVNEFVVTVNNMLNRQSSAVARALLDATIKRIALDRRA